MAAPSLATIRLATETDHEAVLDLWARCGLGSAAPDEWIALVGGETSVVLVAGEPHRVVGSAIASFDGWRAYIYHVAVDPGFRGQGVGHALLEEAEHYLLSAGARNVFVAVNEGNTEGLALVGSEAYVPDGEIVLTKRLASRMS